MPGLIQDGKSPYPPRLRKFSGLLIGGLLLSLTLFLLFYDLAEDMLNQELAFFDQTIADAFIAWRSPSLTSFLTFITSLGSSTVIIILSLAAVFYLLYYRKHKWDAIIFGIAVGGASLMNFILKVSFHRLRPAPPALVNASGFSFPSGHAMDSLVLYGMLLYLVWINFPHGFRTYLFSVFILILVLGIGVSRIYLGVHYPSDVLAGFFAGGIWLIGCILALHSVRHLKLNR